MASMNGPSQREMDEGNPKARLVTAVALLPTPRAQNANERNQALWERPLDEPQNLENALARLGPDALLPTPTPNMLRNEDESVADWESRRAQVKVSAQNGNGFGVPLTKAVQMLPTPRATDGTKGGPNQRGSSGDQMLPSAVLGLDGDHDETPRSMGYSEGAADPQDGPVEVLQDVRGASSPQEVRQAARGSRGVPAPNVLQSDLWQHESDSERGCPQLAGEAAPAEGLPSMQERDASARPPHRPESSEQRPVESDDTVRVVPSEAALARGSGDSDGSSGEGPGDCGCALWGKYAPAVHRWEMVLGRVAPPPSVPNGKGQRRLSALAVEFMMGLPPGWVTDVPDVSRNEQLRILGNGVVPQQAALAVSILLPIALHGWQG